MLAQVRPGSEEDREEELEERLQTVVYSEVGGGASGVKVRDAKGVELDPDASLITDFTVITDLRVGVIFSIIPHVPTSVHLFAHLYLSRVLSYIIVLHSLLQYATIATSAVEAPGSLQAQ